VAKVLGGSFNDTVLAICAGALKRYLQEHAALPCESLKANVPVSLREKGDSQPTNLVASFSADLATHIEDPVERFRAIKRSTRAGKKLLRDMPAADAQLFSTLIYLPGIAMMPPGLKSHFPPVNIVISNLPPIARKRYWNGAELLGMYPVSLLTEGMGLNITFIHYGENVNFGLTACNYSLPDLGPLARYLESALRELEANI
jgi:WS/DGAT/MGAT family acyltransferase